MDIEKQRELFSKGFKLHDTCKNLEKRFAERRKTFIKEVKELHSEITQKQLYHLYNACIKGKYSDSIRSSVIAVWEETEAIKAESLELKRESDKLYQQGYDLESRKWLDPLVYIIPADEYPKLKDCSNYPKRKSCNYGDNETNRWDRCEFMKFQEGKWKCCAQ